MLNETTSQQQKTWITTFFPQQIIHPIIQHQRNMINKRPTLQTMLILHIRFILQKQILQKIKKQINLQTLLIQTIQLLRTPNQITPKSNSTKLKLTLNKPLKRIPLQPALNINKIGKKWLLASCHGLECERIRYFYKPTLLFS